MMLGSPCSPCCGSGVCPFPDEITVQVSPSTLLTWPPRVASTACSFSYGGPSLIYPISGSPPTVGTVTAVRTGPNTYAYDRYDDAGTSKACNQTTYNTWHAAWEASGFNDAAHPVSIIETLSISYTLVVRLYRYGTGTYDPPGVAGTDEYGTTLCGLVDFYYGVTQLNRWSHGIVTEHDFEMIPLASNEGGNATPGTYDPVWTGSGWKPHPRSDGTDPTQYKVWTPDFPTIFGASDTQYRNLLYATASSGFGSITVTT